MVYVAPPRGRVTSGEHASAVSGGDDRGLLLVGEALICADLHRASLFIHQMEEDSAVEAASSDVVHRERSPEPVVASPVPLAMSDAFAVTTRA